VWACAWLRTSHTGLVRHIHEDRGQVRGCTVVVHRAAQDA
jgi:hypothetical protein